MAQLVPHGGPPRARITEQQLTILCIAGYAGAVTRRRIEEVCGGECETILRRMVESGLLDYFRDHTVERAPNPYRLTTTALMALGYPTVEAFRDGVASHLDGAELLKLEKLRPELGHVSAQVSWRR